MEFEEVGCIGGVFLFDEKGLSMFMYWEESTSEEGKTKTGEHLGTEVAVGREVIWNYVKQEEGHL